MKKVPGYIFVALLLLANGIAAQSFTTRVSAKTIGKNDLVEVQYVAENLELSDFILPAYPGWVIQSGPNFSSNRVMSGNSLTQQVIYSVILQPTRTGKLSVPSATITIDRNNSRKSNTVSVEVKNVPHVAGNMQTNSGNQGNSLFDEPSPGENNDLKDQVLRKGENPLTKIKNNILIKLDVSKSGCYVGEAVIATYKLCTRLRSQSRVVKQPEFSGCTVMELTPEQPVAKREMINGKMYNVYIIRRVQLFPLQAGDLELPKASVANNIAFYKEEDLNYRDMFYNRSNPAFEQEVTVSNTVVSLHVKPLPVAQPANFNGAVGKFTIDASMNNDRITTNNNAALNVVIEGEGNLQNISAPTVLWPAGIEGFDPVDQEETDKNSLPVRVRKTFTYPFVVAKKGSYKAPAVSFCFFNPATAQFETIQSAPMSFAVEKGRKQLLPVATLINNSDFQTRLYILIIAAFVAVIAGLYWFNFKFNSKKAPLIKNDEVKPSPVIAAPVFDGSQYIHAISELNPLEDGSFYKLLRKNIVCYLTAGYKVNEDELPTLAQKYPEQAETMHDLNKLLRDCSLGMYTPLYNTEEAMRHRLSAIDLLSRLDKQHTV